MGLLERINAPKDIQSYTEYELATLCDELRSFIVESVSKTGGHLASNLGAVEITVAIHKVFNTEYDRLLFDVGHQSYIHKILTGRMGDFASLRQYGGLAGFPKPSESVHDAFIAGHASAAISEALGMARARTLEGEHYNVIALVGDGALTGGLAYEALCDAGGSKEPLIVILNDNGMSIARNVGGMSRYLSRLRLKRGYRKIKNFYRKATRKIPGGGRLYRATHRVKSAIKNMFFSCSMFEDVGFTYLGPVDGHDINQMVRALEVARDIGGPVIVHAITVKGKGYAPAEKKPDLYHGVSAFDPVDGVSETASVSFSSVFGEKLCELAGENKRIMAITAAMAPGTGLNEFAKKYPKRFFDVGIAEEHAAAMAAGAAQQGMVPVFAVYSTFLQRSYDMLLHDIGIGKEHVVLAVDRSGIVGEDGETHQGLFDVSYLTSVPHMTVLSPASYAELRDTLALAVNEIKGPVAIRYPRGGEGSYREGGTSLSRLLCEGEDFTIITYGISVNNALKAAELLKADGISVDVLKLNFIKPLDEAAIIASVKKTGRVLVLEECVSHGCIGEKISALLTCAGQSPRRLILKNFGDTFVQHGAPDKLRQVYGLDAESVAADIREALPYRRGRVDGKEET